MSRSATTFLDGFYKGYTDATDGRAPLTIVVSGALYRAYVSELLAIKRYMPFEREDKPCLRFRNATIVESTKWTASGSDL